MNEKQCTRWVAGWRPGLHNGGTGWVRWVEIGLGLTLTLCWGWVGDATAMTTTTTNATWTFTRHPVLSTHLGLTPQKCFHVGIYTLWAGPYAPSGQRPCWRVPVGELKNSGDHVNYTITKTPRGLKWTTSHVGKVVEQLGCNMRRRSRNAPRETDAFHTEDLDADLARTDRQD